MDLPDVHLTQSVVQAAEVLVRTLCLLDDHTVLFGDDLEGDLVTVVCINVDLLGYLRGYDQLFPGALLTIL